MLLTDKSTADANLKDKRWPKRIFFTELSVLKRLDS